MCRVLGVWDLTGDLSLIMIQAIYACVCMLMTYTSSGFPSLNFKSLIIEIDG